MSLTRCDPCSSLHILLALVLKPGFGLASKPVVKEVEEGGQDAGGLAGSQGDPDALWGVSTHQGSEHPTHQQGSALHILTAIPLTWPAGPVLAFTNGGNKSVSI